MKHIPMTHNGDAWGYWFAGIFYPAKTWSMNSGRPIPHKTLNENDPVLFTDDPADNADMVASWSFVNIETALDGEK